jgi:diketogulonate reductase-like aldo/keto reductase
MRADEPKPEVSRALRAVTRVALPGEGEVPALGLGTWRMGEKKASAAREVAALKLGLDLGMALIDTAEMYGDGGAEEIVGEAIAGRRDEVFVVSKVYPHNAGRKSAVAACERSLKRLRTDHIDLYLLHWSGRIPVAETVDAFERLRADGKIARWGVSNFDTDAMRRLHALPEGRQCATNQVLYHVGERSIEWDLLPWMREHRMPVMAYCPLGEGALLRNRRLAAIATGVGATPAQLALAWLLRTPDVIAIPESADLAHVRDNRASADLALSASTLADLDAAFPPPREARPLSVV